MKNKYFLKTNLLILLLTIFCSSQFKSQDLTNNNTENKTDSLSNLMNFSDTQEQIEQRKNLLISLSKTGENLFKDLADKKLRKQKGVRLPGERSGIEEMADYRKMITMPLGSNKMLYKRGYLLKEYNKALKSPTLNTIQAKSSPIKSAAYTANNVTFTERGPNNIPGRIRNVIVSASNPNKWYVGTAGGGVWITDDAGVSWRNTTDFVVPSLATSTLTFSESDPNIIYAGTGEPFGNLDALTEAGLIKSMDGGETWTLLANTAEFGSVGRMATHPTDANHLVVGTSRGIYVTKDGGLSWSQTLSGERVQDVKATKDFSELYASASSNGVYKSTDGGTTWNLVFNAGTVNPDISRMEIALAPTNTNRVFISAYAPSSTLFYLSDDGGVTFKEITFQSGDSKEILGSQGWYDNVATFHPTNSNIVYVGGIYLARVKINLDGTYSVLQIGSGYTRNKLNTYVHPDQHGLICQVNAADPSQFRMILTNDGGVYYTDYKTNPGETENDWMGPVTGLNNTQFYGADKKKNADLYIAGAQDNGTSVTITAPASKTSKYNMVLGGDGFEVIWNYDDPNKMLFGSQYNNLVLSKNGTLSYARNSDYGSGTSPFYSKLATANNNPELVFTVSKNGVWRSVDFGENWSLTPFTANNGTWLGSSSAATVKVSVANPDVIWAAAAVGTSPNYRVNVSRDNGVTFTKTSGTVPVSGNYYISGLAASSVEPARAYTLLSVTGQPKILKTNDYGDSWTDITGFTNGSSTVGFPDVSVHSLIEMPFDPNILWAGTDIGIFETVDGGASWHILNNFPPVSIWNMKIVDDQVILATHGRGVWTATIPELTTYELPDYIGPPIVKTFYQAGIHDMRGKSTFYYTSNEITSLKVYVDGTLAGTVANTTANTDYNFDTSALTEGYHTLSVSGVYGSTETIKGSKIGEFIAFNNAAPNINLPTINDTDVFINTDGKFVIDNVSGKFTYNVLNNVGHEYANDTTYQTYLRTPIKVGATSKLDIVHMALTEAEYDYAYIEASKDLINWTPVAAFDESSYVDWTNVAASNVSEALFKTSLLDLTSKFSAGDEVALRLRLTADSYEVRYGWLIKAIVPASSLATNDVETNGERIYLAPNPPVNGTTSVFLPKKIKGQITIGIFDASGKSVQTINTDASSKIDLDVRALNRGVYLILVKGETFTKALKLLR